MSNLVPLSLVADAAGVSRRALEIAAAKIVSGERDTWRGSRITVVPVKGRGGKAGVQYHVRVDTLPRDLQARINAPSKALLPAPKLPVKTEKFAAVMTVFGSMFSEIDATRPGTKARADIYRAWSEKYLPDVKGSAHSRRYSVRTLQRLHQEHQGAGVAALVRRGRNDKGRKRVVLTARYDAWAREAGLSPSDLEAIAENVKDYIRSWHKELEGVAAIRAHAIRRLENLTREHGFEPPAGVCDIPWNLVKAEKKYRAFGIYKKDRKAWEDKSPAISRTKEGLWPNDVVVGDVHPLDFMLQGGDEYQNHAKAICWLDVATMRLWMTIVFLPKGRGIRNADVINSFKEMVAAWGLPKTLYLDNGSEYNFADFIKDAMKLNGLPVFGPEENDSNKSVRRAKPYSARSKEIEGVFAKLRHFTAKVPGYIGGNRLKTKVANVGKPPAPFPGNFEQFRVVMAGILAQYHSIKHQTGELKGLSPIEAYNRAVKSGWEKTECDPNAFAIVFSETKACAPENGRIKVNGRDYYSDALASHFDGYVNVRVPKYEHWDRLPIEDVHGKVIAYAEEERRYGYFDPAGAKESGRRKTLLERFLV